MIKLHVYLAMIFIAPNVFASECDLYSENVVDIKEYSVFYEKPIDKLSAKKAILENDKNNFPEGVFSAIENAVIIDDLELIKDIYKEDAGSYDAMVLAAQLGKNEIFKWFLYETEAQKLQTVSTYEIHIIFSTLLTDNVEGLCLVYEKFQNFSMKDLAGRSLFHSASLYGAKKSMMFILSKGYELTKADRKGLSSAIKVNIALENHKEMMNEEFVEFVEKLIQYEQIYWPNSSEYKKVLQNFTFDENSARKALIEKTKNRERVYFDYEPIFIAGDNYFFGIPEKNKIPIQGYYVNGNTLEIEYRESKVSVTSKQSKIKNSDFEKIIVIN